MNEPSELHIRMFRFTQESSANSYKRKLLLLEQHKELPPGTKARVAETWLPVHSRSRQAFPGPIPGRPSLQPPISHPPVGDQGGDGGGKGGGGGGGAQVEKKLYFTDKMP